MRITDEMLDRFLDGDVSTAEHQAVLAWLQHDDHLLEFTQRAELHHDLYRTLRRQRLQKEVLSACTDTPWNDASTAPVDGSVARSPNRTTTKSITTLVAFAASVAAVFLIYLFGFQRAPERVDAAPAVARLVYQSNARWLDGNPPQDEAIGTGILHLDVGIARLDFTNGAAVTLQGPARFEIASGTQTRLHHGILTAHIPASAVGFEVETPAMDVIDRGTSFGVSVGADGETDVCVFEGEVEVSLASAAGDQRAQRVTEGTAVRTRPQASEIESVDYEPTRYEDSWPVTTGVLQATGLMKFVSPGPDFVPGRYEDNHHILVFPERSQVLTTADIAVDVATPGQYQRMRNAPQKTLPAGQRVRSYLLQLDPIGEIAKRDTNKARVIGQITFDRPILGLIVRTTKLNATDKLLGHPRGDYGNTRRGIEPPRPDEALETGRDLVTLSDDRRTLSLDLSAGSAVDQIRVIVRENDPSKENDLRDQLASTN